MYSDSPEKHGSAGEEVSLFYENLPEIVENLHALKEKFKAGQTRHNIEEWKNITSDENILNHVLGVEIVFTDFIPEGGEFESKFSNEESKEIDIEINELLKKGVITVCERKDGDFVSPIFTRPKKDGKVRLILNLKKLNKSVEYHHFKMETLKQALTLITEGCWFASLDLKEAYFSIHIKEESQEFLKFIWKGQLYKFTVFPNGLACCPRIFTKILKPVMAYLHQKGFISTIFIDDTLLMGDSEFECIRNVQASLDIFQKLGFVIHPTKSILTPVRQITYLGFVINSEDMTVTPTDEKKNKIKELAIKLLDQGSSSIRILAKFIGMVVASFPGVIHGPLWYRRLENDKIEALKRSKGDYDATVTFSIEAAADMKWWRDNIDRASNVIDDSHGEPDIIIYSDASNLGWGCNSELGRSNGHWSEEEQSLHINVKELTAAWFAIKALTTNLSNKHIRLMLDNTTAVACVNNMGTNHSILCDLVVRDIWGFCIEREFWVSAAYIPGKLNVEADTESRKINLDAEWKLNNSLLKQATDILNYQPEIDLFATRLNCQYEKYVSYRPDPEAIRVDAFSINWSKLNWYAFPPFCLIPRVLRKISREKSTGVLVVPYWPSQPWFPRMTGMLVEKPIVLSARNNLLTMPGQPEEKHRLYRTLKIVICMVSGKDTEIVDFQGKLQTSSAIPGGKGQPGCMTHTSEGGKSLLIKGKLVPIVQL